LAEIIDLKTKARYRIYTRFPPLQRNEIPQIYEITPIEYEKERIEEFDVILWHRLLKSIYQEPIEIECELHTKDQVNIIPETAILRRLEEKPTWELLGTTEENVLKIQSGEIKPIFSNWKYFFKLPSGGIVSIGTKNRVTSLYIAHVAVGKQLSAEDIRAAEEFILLLLDEAKKSQLFNPKKEFSKAQGLQSYSLFNVYLANYVSAQFMLATAVAEEATLRDEFQRHDARRLDLAQEEREHINKFMLACGMYYSSAITYFYMALEGFINITFDSFLQKQFRDGALNIEKRFDIEQKLRFLPVLCDGFAQEYVGPTSDIFSKFRKLTDYRNTIFHSKLEESLRSLAFVEDGFLYQCHLSKVNKQFLPSLKIMLTANNVLEVQRLVDEIVEMVLNSMTEEANFLANKYIRNSAIIPFYIGADGSQSMGESKIKTTE
jgi:hypothetical protein